MATSKEGRQARPPAAFGIPSFPVDDKMLFSSDRSPLFGKDADSCEMRFLSRSDACLS
jgi:hypothetical protein